jgi:replicative DNA helicase
VAHFAQLVAVYHLQLWAKVAEDLRGNFSVRERVDMLGACCASSLWACAARCWRWRRRTAALAITAMTKAAPCWIRSKKAVILEYAADVVVFLIEAQERMATPPARAVELTVAKNRHGDTGKVGLIFRLDLGAMHQEARP